MLISFRSLFAAVLACCFYTLSPTAHAVTISVWDVIYQQDFNGDGRLDYIITPPVKWSTVAVGGINTMVPIAQPYSVLLQQADGSYVLQQQNNFTILDPKIQGLTGLSRTFLDFNGDGNLDFLLRTGDAKGVVVFGNDKAASTSASVDLSAYTHGGNLVMTVSDVNGDGIRDIVLKEDDVITAIAYGNSNNTYSQLSYQFPANNPANLVVNLAGSLDVNDLGAASYSLPIDLPPGMNGLQPSVSIDYSSMSGNGPMGIGWNLSASSAVNRCGSTLARDGLHDGVDFDSTDKFCLDGQRLLSIRQNTYAQADQTMVTEAPTFQKIVPSGTFNGDPALFTVTQADGKVRVYGGSASNRILNRDGRVVSYLLSEMRDVSGNKINYVYTTEYGLNTYYLKEIQYNGYSVTIASENRADLLRGYLAPKTRYENNRRISKISVLNQGQTLYHYDLQYEEVDNLKISRLRNIVRCLKVDATTCTAPLAFSYEKEEGVMGNFKVAYDDTPQPVEKFTVDSHRYKTGDFNGDGLTDFAQFATPTTLKVWLANTSGAYSSFNIKTTTVSDYNLSWPAFDNDVADSTAKCITV